MKITVLAENTTISEKYKSEHGLSFYIETKNHKILFDVGASSLFAENAKKMNIDLTKIDTVIISHGHYDHGGGLKTFLGLNSTAKIYIRKSAFNDYFSEKPSGEKVYIGLDKEIILNPRFMFTETFMKIDDELELYSGVEEREFFSKSNNALFMKEDDKYVNDKFEHEQNLIITENENTALFAGCAHNGIINIINKFVEIKWEEPKYVFGGLHLSNPRSKKIENEQLISEIGCKLSQYNSEYFTCHCTGEKPYFQLKQILKDRIHYVATGAVVEINSANE
ncbi:MAG: MBL fold metallo-hydrolase [Clostridia bacterium]|nr:MBL fold metallo-hydrolase [Clostridia bacterium]